MLCWQVTTFLLTQSAFVHILCKLVCMCESALCSSLCDCCHWRQQKNSNITEYYEHSIQLWGHVRMCRTCVHSAMWVSTQRGLISLHNNIIWWGLHTCVQPKASWTRWLGGFCANVWLLSPQVLGLVVGGNCTLNMMSQYTRDRARVNKPPCDTNNIIYTRTYDMNLSASTTQSD